jgi:hypothetical protein
MKMRISKALFLAPSLLLLGGSTAFADAVVTLEPGTVSPGQTVTVAVHIEGPTVKGEASDASDVYAFQLSLSYPSSLLRARHIEEGTFLSAAGATLFSNGRIDRGSGTITDIDGTLVSAPSGASGSGTLVNITFQAITSGTPQITLSKITLLDSHMKPIVVDDTPAQVTTTITTTSAHVESPRSFGMVPAAAAPAAARVVLANINSAAPDYREASFSTQSSTWIFRTPGMTLQFPRTQGRRAETFDDRTG